jgi:hypothetical protein
MKPLQTKPNIVSSWKIIYFNRQRTSKAKSEAKTYSKLIEEWTRSQHIPSFVPQSPCLTSAGRSDRYHKWNDDPISGCQIGTKWPILHAILDLSYWFQLWHEWHTSQWQPDAITPIPLVDYQNIVRWGLTDLTSHHLARETYNPTIVQCKLHFRDVHVICFNIICCNLQMTSKAKSQRQKEKINRLIEEWRCYSCDLLEN